MSEKMIKVALAGNPNCGKTTLFNSLTGSTAYVGNWPGVTVEKREGTYVAKDKTTKADIVDLPGIYSLSPYSPEEVISRNYILNEKPDIVINVVDATNLERNLYMTTQIIEMDVPVVVAINMTDALSEIGQSIDYKKLEKALGVPVVAISALRNKGLDELMSVAIKESKKERKGNCILTFEKIKEAEAIYKDNNIDSPLFHAVKALEKDELEENDHKDEFKKVQALVASENKDYEADIADARYVYLTPLCEDIVKGKEKKEKDKLTKSDKIDKVLTHKVFGLIILVVLLFLVFHITFSADILYLHAMGVDFGEGYAGAITFTLGEFDAEGELIYYTPFAGLFYTADGINSIGEFFHVLAGDNETGILGLISLGIKKLLLIWNSPEWVIGFIYNGVINGVTAVLGFVPQIMILFAFFSLMEDSGYMARVAFMLDRIFRRFGVSGRAFIPMIMGFGCGVPAMINTRTLASDKERTKTIRVVPFFTCGAKATFLAVIAGTVAGAVGIDAGLFTFLMYLMGMVVAVVSVIVMNKTSQREKVPPFIMELPSYHRPQIKATLIHVWDKGKHFIKKAFTIILASTVVIWFFANFDWSWHMVEENGNGSILMSIGSLIQPIFTPMGFGVQAGSNGWALTVASLQGIVAKENVTSVAETLAAVLGVDGFAGIVEATGISTAAVVAFAVFNLLTIPCFASVATAKSELSDKKTYWFTILFWMGLSYVMGCFTYISIQYVWTLGITLPLIAIGFVVLYFYDKKKKVQEAAVEA